MKNKLCIHYDRKGDFLEVRFGKPTSSYYEDRGDDIFERRDEKTNEIKGYAFFNITNKKRKQLKEIIIELPSITYS